MTLPKIGFVICSNSEQPIPSTRIAVLNMLPYLHAAGYKTDILFEPDAPCETPDLSGVFDKIIQAGFDVIVLQKVHGTDASLLAARLGKRGVKTIYAVCDRIDLAMVGATDATIVVTEHLKTLCPVELQSRIFVVHDGIEHPAECKIDWGKQSGSLVRPLQAVLVTSSTLNKLPALVQPPLWLNLRIIGQYAKELQRLQEQRWAYMELPRSKRFDYLRFILNPRIQCIPWSPRKVYGEMLAADIGVIPIDTNAARPTGNKPPAWQLKSENRLTMKMSIGLPVIATPIPAYEAVIEHGVNGFFASSKHDWEACFRILRDREARADIGRAARETVNIRFSKQEQSSKFIEAIQSVL